MANTFSKYTIKTPFKPKNQISNISYNVNETIYKVDKLGVYYTDGM